MKTSNQVQSPLRDHPLPYKVWGGSGIDAGALDQMNNAMRLPITASGALMPDAHIGYGLPIGGVLATYDSVIPYAVGVDISCMMRLSVFEADPSVLDKSPTPYIKAVQDSTYFGAGQTNPTHPDHPVLDQYDWDDTKFLRDLRQIGANQIGTSGSGNHFAEWGELDLTASDSGIDLPPGRYLALLSHSGSRAVGFKIANQYSRLAMERHGNLPAGIRQLGWLSLTSDDGREYWRAMQLAGRFASANHELIHRDIAAAAGLTPLAAVENKHNLAWVEKVLNAEGVETEAIVHRKGATPAARGVLGIIPGSMGDPGHVVRGKGNQSSLNSAAHGAGRAMGRRQASKSITAAERDAYLAKRHVTLLGGGLDESPQAYKRIEEVMAAQTDLVDVLGTFTPRIVKMANERGVD
jgi:tRNA-splicing ligase RtcB (3'-phosphate/5'-hydroxy nucleic acid ligase)